MSELENIEKLVAEYKPRIEAIFGMEIGDVHVKEYSFQTFQEDFLKVYDKLIGREMNKLERGFYKILLKSKYKNKSFLMITLINQVYVNFENLNKVKGLLPLEELVKRATVHELSHAMVFNNKLLNANIENEKICKYLSEGFAEYVSLEFSEIYQDERTRDYLKTAQKKEKEYLRKGYSLRTSKIEKIKHPYIKGYEFFKRVAEKIGRKNVLKVFQKPPQTMEEILQPEKYLKRIDTK